MLPFRLPPEIARRLEMMGEATGRSDAFRAFEAALKHICALEDICIAEQRLADLKAGRTETIKLEDLMLQFRKTDSAPLRGA
jgi:RHH-type rel operon transcriptional repressor/antitoxin RelB